MTSWLLVQLAFDSRPSMDEGLRQSQDDIGFRQSGRPVPDKNPGRSKSSSNDLTSLNLEAAAARDEAPTVATLQDLRTLDNRNYHETSGLSRRVRYHIAEDNRRSFAGICGKSAPNSAQDDHTE